MGVLNCIIWECWRALYGSVGGHHMGVLEGIIWECWRALYGSVGGHYMGVLEGTWHYQLKCTHNYNLGHCNSMMDRPIFSR